MVEDKGKTRKITNELVPKYVVLSDGDGEKVLKELGIKREQLPKILTTDAMIANDPDAKAGRIISIEREDVKGIKYKYYRLIVEPL
ncbi:MAG: DNA-directed RNA polymerase subunit RpoH/Rpb5 C-terminal domain-containing protein [Candidatus Micrarchaeia archaeon]